MINDTVKKDLIDYFDTVVKPTVEESLNKQNDLRLARLACIVLWHTLDYIKLVSGKETQKITNDINFIYVRDVCNTTKHFKLKQNKDSRKIDSSEQIKYHPHTGEGLFTVPFGEATFDNSGIYIETNNKEYILIDSAICQTMKILEREISSIRK